MIGPRTAEDATTPAEKPRGYPFLTMVPMETVERPAASAVAEPEIPDKMTSATMMTWQSPPRREPTRLRAKSNRRWVIPVWFMSEPARMKKGMAR